MFVLFLVRIPVPRARLVAVVFLVCFDMLCEQSQTWVFFLPFCGLKTDGVHLPPLGLFRNNICLGFFVSFFPCGSASLTPAFAGGGWVPPLASGWEHL